MSDDKAIRAAMLTAKNVKPVAAAGFDSAAQNIADYVAELLREGRASEVTNDLMAQADPQRLWMHYKNGNTGVDLPMDKDSRMARAAQMGLTEDTIHGTLTSKDFKSFKGEGRLGQENYVAPNTENGRKLAAQFSTADQGRILPLLTPKPMDTRNLDDRLRFEQMMDDKNRLNDFRMKGGYRASGLPGWGDQWAIDTANEAGEKALRLHERDWVDSTAVFDPRNMRSQFARFDPRLSHLSDLNAATGGAILDKRHHQEAVERAQGQIAPSKYLPNVQRAVHAAGSYVPQAALPVGRLAIARPLQTAPQQGFAGGLSELASAAGNVSDLVTGKKPEEVQQSADPNSGTAYTGDISGKAPSLTFGDGVSEKARNAFDALAASWGQPLEVVSAYRDPKRNEAVGGAKGSQHIHGNAFDINTANLSYEDRLKLADAAWEAGFRGFGFYDNSMHFDVGDQRAWGPNYHGDSIPDWARGWWDARMGYAAGGKVDDKRANFLAGNHHEVPPVVYHSTRGDFTGFRPMSHFGTRQAAHDRYNDKWHPAHLEMSRATHDVSIIPAHISLKNPLDVGRERDWRSNRDTIRQIADTMFKSGRIDQDYLKAAEGLYDLVDDPRWGNYPHAIEQRAADLLRGAGHDGVIYTNTIEDPGSRSFITLGPEQVKSAISAREFDPTNPDMTKAEGGSVGEGDIPDWSGNPDFQKWFGASKAVDETGSPLVLYHGTNQNIDQFDPKRGGTATGENAGATKGFFFTDSKDVAQQYADRAGRTVIPNVVEHEREAQRLQREVARLEASAHRTGNWDAYERAVEAWEDHEAKARNASDDEGKNIVHAHLSLQNPKIVDFGGGRLSMDRDLDSMIEEAKADGHDGMILRNLEDSPQMGIVSNHYVAFAPHQIKSVHNSGRFDPKDPRIHRANGGSVADRSPMFEGMSDELRDEDGKPLELWHGTPVPGGFDRFDNSRLGERDAGFYGRGHYLTPDKEGAEEYAYDDQGEPGTVMGPMHAALKNPYVWDVSDDDKAHRTLRDLQSMGLMRDRSEMRSWDNLQRHEINRFMDHMKQRGHDGVIMKTHRGPQEIVVFNPNMIKHRDAEVGDPNDPRIMRASGGRLYSKAAQIIRGLKQEKGTAEDMIRAAIGRGAKKNEIEYANPPGGKISRDELAQHFESAVPKIDVRKLEEGNFRYDSPERYERQINYLYRQNRYPEAEALEREFERFEGFGGKDAAKYARFQLPGGENYREHILTLPGNPGDRFYATNHWGKTENPIGHIRMSDRTVAPPHDQMMEIMGRVMDHGQGIDGAVEHGVVTPQEGATLARHFGLDSSAYFDKPGLDKKILHVEEAQSDWASGARKHGFRTGTEKQDYDAYVENMRQQMINRIDASPMVRDGLIEKYKKMDPYMLAMKLGAQNEHLEMARKASDHNPAVPKAPYTDPSGDEWNQLAMKHVLHEAAHGGYDGITFTPDAAQSARWGGTDFSGIYDKKLPAAAHKLVQMHDQSVKADQINLPGTTAPSAVIPLTPEARESIKQNGFPAFRRGGYVTTIRRPK